MSVLEAKHAPNNTETSRRSQQQGPARRPGAKPLAIVRILLGSVFLWAFVDKVLGLGFATSPDKAWLAGGSPTAGYLGSLEGALAGTFQPLAGQPLVDWAFMLGLLGLGTALVLGIGMRTAAIGGCAMLALMWLSSLPLKNNPVIDEHIIYSAVLIALAATSAGHTWGLGRAWDRFTSATPALRWAR
ncbi:DoxX family membrane protein [Arthrobacter sp. H5]|uniref:DoxX family membrane protein n=1 Tax=Arthrobacter sp. H5 TaxID=1267973 RepID=UPI0004B4C187|nr:DoxX family membrane protein [Arthrobacter sp. H5]